MKEFYMRLYHFFLGPQGSYFKFFNLLRDVSLVLLRSQCCSYEAILQAGHPICKLKNHSFWKCMEFLITKQSATSTAAHNMYFTRHREKLDRVVQLEFSILRRIFVRRKVLALCQKTLILQCHDF